MYDNVNDVKIVAAVVAAVVGVGATDGTPVNIDRSGYEALAFDINVGAEGDVPSGSVKFEFIVAHADDNGSGAPNSYSPCDAADLVFPAWAANMVYASGGIVLTLDGASESPCVGSVGYVGNKRWVKITPDATGTTNGTPMAVNARLSKPHYAPISA